MAFLLQDYKEKPDYGRCVAIVASASLREMIKPGALAIISPIAVGEFISVAFCSMPIGRSTVLSHTLKPMFITIT